MVAGFEASGFSSVARDAGRHSFVHTGFVIRATPSEAAQFKTNESDDTLFNGQAFRGWALYILATASIGVGL